MDRRKGSFGLNQILGLFMYPFALLLFAMGEAWIVAQQMAKKIVTNEFVVMGEISKVVDSYSPSQKSCYFNILSFIC